MPRPKQHRIRNVGIELKSSDHSVGVDALGDPAAQGRSTHSPGRGGMPSPLRQPQKSRQIQAAERKHTRSANSAAGRARPPRLTPAAEK